MASKPGRVEPMKWREAFLESSDFSSTTRLVLLILLSHMDKDGRCFPSVRTIARRAGMRHKAVCRHLDLAERAGWISRSSARFDGQRWRRNSYKARLPEGVQDVGVVAVVAASERCAPSGLRWCPPGPKVGSQGASNSSTELSNELSNTGTTPTAVSYLEEEFLQLFREYLPELPKRSDPSDQEIRKALRANSDLGFWERVFEQTALALETGSIFIPGKKSEVPANKLRFADIIRYRARISQGGGGPGRWNHDGAYREEGE